MIDGIRASGAGHVYSCSCGYQVVGTIHDAEKAQRIHRHRYLRHGRCNHQALTHGRN